VIVFWAPSPRCISVSTRPERIFRSFFVYWTPTGSGFHVPIFPAGYFIGTILLINLLCAHVVTISPAKKNRHRADSSRHRAAVARQMLTDFLAVESNLHLRIGETRNYTEADRALNWRSSTPPTRTPTRSLPSLQPARPARRSG